MDGGTETGWKETFVTVTIKEPIASTYGGMMVV